MAFSQEITDQMTEISELVEKTTELKVILKMQATLLIQVKILKTLKKKGLFGANEMNLFIRDIEANAAFMSIASPEIGMELAGLALKLRHELLPEKSKPN